MIGTIRVSTWFLGSAATLLLAGMLSPSAEAGTIGVKTIEIKTAFALGNWLQVSEVVATQSGTLTDVALATNGGTAIGSSNYQNGPSSPSFAIDGISPSSYPSIFHSGSTSVSEFLRIVLSVPTELDSVTIYGRVDCCSDRDKYNVRLLDSSNNVLFSATADAFNAGHVATVNLPNTATQIAPVSAPEPASLGLLGLGLAGLGYVSRRRKLRRQ